MIGLDYKSAPIDIREKISLTQSNIVTQLKKIYESYSIGVVIVSTCNRTEIYLASEHHLSDDFIINLYQDSVKAKTPFYLKRDRELVDYLFELACGMHSMILGEDQIITQINDAIELSIEHKTGNSAINTLFRHSITCAKKAKTQVNIKFISPSIVSQAVEIAKNEICNLSDKKILVIGNGEMGRLSAELFEQQGCEVYMTLRSYKYHVAEVPKNCKSVKYENKHLLYPMVDIIVSATKSPHHTVHFDDVVNLEQKPKYMFDLALPRDIEPKVKTISEIACFDVDDIGQKNSHYDMEAIEKIKEIISEQKFKFNKWLDFYDNIQKGVRV